MVGVSSVAKGAMVWGVKRSFVDYVAESDGTVTVSEGASDRSDGFVFAQTSVVTELSGSVQMRHTGSVRFEAYGGMLDVVILDPWITVSGGEGELSVVDVSRLPDRSHRVVIASLALSANGPVALREVRQASLTAAGSRLLGSVYATGTELDPVSWVVR